MKPGKVYIGGAGPGDPGLVTLRLLEVIREADAILYDRLLCRSILAEAKESAELVDVGKRGDEAARGAEQERINALLVEYASRGKAVLRLKGGDPFVFGRGAEECEALSRAGILFEVIPGVSSAVAVPAYAGIPLTHRDCASSFAVAAGRREKGTDLDVPRADTIVYLMGVGNLAGIVEKIVAAGRPGRTPAALIREGTRARQRTIVGTLETIAGLAAAASVSPPAVLVVGDAVRMRERLCWHEKKTLFGTRVVVTRPREKRGRLSGALRALGAEVHELPVISLRPLEEARGRFRSPESLDRFTDVIFTSETGVRLFFDRLMDAGGDARRLAGKSIVAIGPATTESLGARGIAADLVPAVYTAEGIMDKLEGDLRGRLFLLPRAKGARRLLPEEIARRGGEVDEWLLYEAVPLEIDAGELEGADAFLFTSSSAVRNLCRAAGVSREIPAICIGPATARTAEEEGFHRVHVSKEATIRSLVEEVVGVLGHEEHE